MAKQNEENNDKHEKPKAGVRQWVYGILAVVCTILFVIWTGYWPVLILIPVFIDIYITKFIRWGAWKESKNPKTKRILDWVDAILFALVGVYFITTFFFQNYQIPSSSLEKSLLVGDFLCVSKISYGARSPMTPLSFPLAQHTLPILNTKSYIDKPQLEYKRFAGTGKVKHNDIVVFNYPSGDTVAINYQNQDYYALCKRAGRANVWANPQQYGKIVYRPVDRRENYVKRCVGLPGDVIEVRNDSVFINDQPSVWPENAQLTYFVQTDGTTLAQSIFDELGVSEDDYMQVYSNGDKSPRYYKTVDSFQNPDSTYLTGLGLKYTNGGFGLLYILPLTNKMVAELKSKPFVTSVIGMNKLYKAAQVKRNADGGDYVYPITYAQDYYMGEFPKTWIPKRGETITFDTDVERKVETYIRCIKNNELKDFDYRDGKVYIDRQQADSYTFELDYYFMMGDNRDNSADSRSWGFVPENHIVGKPMFIWLSLDKDKGWFSGKIRWNRLFTTGNKP